MSFFWKANMFQQPLFKNVGDLYWEAFETCKWENGRHAAKYSKNLMHHQLRASWNWYEDWDNVEHSEARSDMGFHCRLASYHWSSGNAACNDFTAMWLLLFREHIYITLCAWMIFACDGKRNPLSHPRATTKIKQGKSMSVKLLPCSKDHHKVHINFK